MTQYAKYDFGPCWFTLEIDEDDGTEHIYICYHEEDNVYSDMEGQVIPNLNYLITPHQRWMFRQDPFYYDEFPCQLDPNIHVHVGYFPAGAICEVNCEQAMKLAERYEKFERDTWRQFTCVGG